MSASIYCSRLGHESPDVSEDGLETDWTLVECLSALNTQAKVTTGQQREINRTTATVSAGLTRLKPGILHPQRCHLLLQTRGRYTRLHRHASVRTAHFRRPRGVLCCMWRPCCGPRHPHCGQGYPCCDLRRPCCGRGHPCCDLRHLCCGGSNLRFDLGHPRWAVRHPCCDLRVKGEIRQNPHYTRNWTVYC